MIIRVCISGLFVLFLMACNTSDEAVVHNNTPTSGKVTVFVDDAYTHLFSAFKNVFEHTYKNASISLDFKTEPEVIAAFRNGDAPLICLSRQLTEDEMKEMKERGYYIKVLPFAADAIAFVGNQLSDSTYTEEEIVCILTSGFSSKLITKSSDTIQVVFDKNNTGTAAFLRDSVLQIQTLGKNCYALSSVEEVYNYVRTHRNSIGVLAVNHISDRYDEQIHKSLQGLRIIAVAKNKTPDNFVKPLSENIVNGSYPFLRNIYLINGDGANGLATGFAAFVLSDIGMTIIEQIGLKPAKEPVRVIEIRKSFE